MADVINKWKVISKLIDLENAYTYHKEEWDAQTLSRKIDELESEIGDWDALDLVRCKDCEFRKDVLDNGCFLCKRKMIGVVRPDDFCSYGERKDDGA